MFTVHLPDPKTERPLCGAFSDSSDRDLKKVDCRECLEARMAQINLELEALKQRDQGLGGNP